MRSTYETWGWGLMLRTRSVRGSVTKKWNSGGDNSSQANLQTPPCPTKTKPSPPPGQKLVALPSPTQVSPVQHTGRSW